MRQVQFFFLAWEFSSKKKIKEYKNVFNFYIWLTVLIEELSTICCLLQIKLVNSILYIFFIFLVLLFDVFFFLLSFLCTFLQLYLTSSLHIFYSSNVGVGSRISKMWSWQPASCIKFGDRQSQINGDLWVYLPNRLLNRA